MKYQQRVRNGNKHAAFFMNVQRLYPGALVEVVFSSVHVGTLEIRLKIPQLRSGVSLYS